MHKPVVLSSAVQFIQMFLFPSDSIIWWLRDSSFGHRYKAQLTRIPGIMEKQEMEITKILKSDSKMLAVYHLLPNIWADLKPQLLWPHAACAAFSWNSFSAPPGWEIVPVSRSKQGGLPILQGDAQGKQTLWLLISLWNTKKYKPDDFPVLIRYSVHIPTSFFSSPWHFSYPDAAAFNQWFNTQPMRCATTLQQATSISLWG